jgi:prepilin signal peptidase PulO-like enzyme (type II secretory pathway)
MDVNIGTIIMASMPGIILLVIALITGKAGTADGIVLWILGILSDWKSTVLILSISLFIMGVYSAIMLLLHKVNKESEIPFIPFISMAYTIYAFRSIYVLPH